MAKSSVLCIKKQVELAVKIAPYDNKASEIFKRIKRSIYNTVSYEYEIEVEHIGSTAVKGIGGKGIIDILTITEKEYMRK